MREYESVTITTNKQANEMLAKLDAFEGAVQIAAFDTETNGLHIIQSKPFVFQFGYLHPTEHKGYTYAVDIERHPQLANQVIEAWHKRASKMYKYLAHNCKFDLHMLTNNGTPYLTENVSDTMFYIRYAHDALTPANGGPPMGLKPYCVKYIDPRAKTHDALLQSERSAIAKSLNLKLKKRLQCCGRPPQQYKAASYTLSVLQQIFNDPLATVQNLPTEAARIAYDDWLHLDVPAEIRPRVTALVETDMIPYNWCNRQNLLNYAHWDIIYVLEVYDVLKDIVLARGNQCGIDIEEKLIFPLYEMERVGFSTDVEYLKSAEIKMREYILQQRQRLHDLSGEQFSISQHAKVLEILQNLGVPLESSRDDELARQKTLLPKTHPAVEIISVIQELRTLEKWYSVYIKRFLYDLRNTDKLYTTINQVGTVSGRVTSDFQQFPKKGIVANTGEVLFHPRHMIRTKHKGIVYLDYSQIELRFQAMYTILVGHPDTNLCRAYMPYKCHTQNGVTFDYHNQTHLKQAYSVPWYYDEMPDKQWTPTDVHGATTKAAFDIDETHPDFHDLRYVGKRVNFAKNYGAQYNKIRSMFPEYSDEQAQRINDAYYKAFPGVKEYHNYCYQRANWNSCTSNLFGIKYYGVSGHKLINLLVQGSAAFYLKIKERELYDYTKTHGLKSQWQMQIHDELSWEYSPEDPLTTLFEFKRIMEDWPDGLVPIVADMEFTTSTWDAKKEVSDLNALQSYISA